MDSCGDHYGSRCNFSCAVGYRLNGSSTVTCNAPGNSPPGVWDSPIPVCQGTFSGYNIDVVLFISISICYTGSRTVSRTFFPAFTASSI